MMYAEEEHIRWCNGQVYYLAGETSVHFIWQPSQESSGLAMSRSFDDYCRTVASSRFGGDAKEDQQ
jgi:hypothetical protein